MEIKFKELADWLSNEAQNICLDNDLDFLDRDVEYISNFWDGIKQKESLELFYSVTLADPIDIIMRDYTNEIIELETRLKEYASEWVNMCFDEFPTPIYKQEVQVYFGGNNNRVTFSHRIYFQGEC